jgi:hypothetical protein
MYALGVVAMIWVLSLLAAVLLSVFSDADRLVDAGGPWMLLLYLVVPTCVAAPWLIGLLREYRENRYYDREGEKALAEYIAGGGEDPDDGTFARWVTLREGDKATREGMAALSAAEKRARGEPPTS